MPSQKRRAPAYAPSRPLLRSPVLQSRHLLVIGGLLALVGAGLIGAYVLSIRRGPISPAAVSAPRALILDQVAVSYPSPDFTRQAVDDLSMAGYDVDIYTGEQITVELLRSLPSLGYKLIVFRTHSTSDFVGSAPQGKPVFIYTGERHSRHRYLNEQVARQIMAGRIRYEESAPPLFIVGPSFVRQSMQGTFADTLLLIGGCDSLSSPELAEAFMARGAAGVVGWNGLVDADHNDRALLHLVRLITRDGLSPQAAVARTRDEIGPDPLFKSLPLYFPTQAAGARTN
jgi:hypothetical protein